MTNVRMVTLGAIATIERDVIEASAVEDGTPYVGLENIQSGGDFVDVRQVSAGELASSKFSFTPQHLLYGKLRPYLAKIARPDFGGICSTDILPVLPGPDLDRGYLAHFLLRPDSVAWATSRAAGANLPRLSPRVLAEMAIPVPPLSEQRRIAEVLDRAEALRVKRRAAIAQLDTVIDSIFLEMFGDPVAKGWRTSTVSEVARSGPASIRTGPFGSQLLHGEFVDRGIAVLGIDNVVWNEFRWGGRRFISEDKYRRLKRYTVRPGDVLITIMGTCGRCAIVPDDIPVAINTKHLCCITLDARKCLPVFLHGYFLRHPLARRYLERTAKGAIMAGLNMEIIKAMPIPLPPIELQEEFAGRVAAVGRLEAAQQVSLAHLDALFVSLQQRAFRGEPLS